MAATPSVKQTKPKAPATAWQKGKSGNPNGRPRKMTPDGKSISELARAHTEVALKALVKIATRGESEAAVVSASTALLDRGWGKPTQPISGDDERPPIEYVVWPVPVHRLEAAR